jgi:hypothetical protein
MNVVARPEMAPGFCLLSLKDEDPEGFVDFAISPAVVDPRVYASVGFLKECGRKLGQVDGSVVEGLERRIADLEAQLAEADRELNAVYVLKNGRFNPASKPGRPAKAA